MKIYTNIAVFFEKYEFSTKNKKKMPLKTTSFSNTSKPI
jgi:hypothetical protein